jgi:hypothetical protein
MESLQTYGVQSAASASWSRPALVVLCPPDETLEPANQGMANTDSATGVRGLGDGGTDV